MSINRILADLGKAVDSSSTGNFLSKEAAGAEFNPVQWSDINSAPTILDSALASAIIDSAYIQARQSGVGSGGIDSATTIALIDSSYVAARAPTGGSGFVKYQYTATASQTTFQDSDVNGNVLSYDADYILVHYNGVLLPSADYTATDGSSVVLGTGADSGSIIGIAKWGAAAGSSSGGGFALGGDRALVMGGGLNTNNQISYYSITTSATAQDFGDCTTAQAYNAATSDGTTGIWTGSFNGNGIINYVTISSPSNATDFGDNNGVHGAWYAGLGDGTYAVWGGGYSGGNSVNTMSYVTIATPSNTSDFGDLHTQSERLGGTCGDQTYGLWVGGNSGSFLNNIQYMTVATPANASDFGDLTVARHQLESVANETYAVNIGGVLSSYSQTNTIDYFAIATPGNASDFGDVTGGTAGWPAASTDGTYGSFHLGLNGSATADVHNVTIDTPGNSTDHCDLLSSTYYALGACSGSPS